MFNYMFDLYETIYFFLQFYNLKLNFVINSKLKL